MNTRGMHAFILNLSLIFHVLIGPSSLLLLLSFKSDILIVNDHVSKLFWKHSER